MFARLSRVVVVALVIGGCGDDVGRNREQETFACSRGFRADDWTSERLRTGQSLARCEWFVGRHQRAVRRMLGEPSFRNGPLLTWELGHSTRGLGPTGWFLVIELDRTGPSGRVTGARTYTKAT